MPELDKLVKKIPKGATKFEVSKYCENPQELTGTLGDFFDELDDYGINTLTEINLQGCTNKDLLYGEDQTLAEVKKLSAKDLEDFFMDEDSSLKKIIMPNGETYSVEDVPATKIQTAAEKAIEGIKKAREDYLLMKSRPLGDNVPKNIEKKYKEKIKKYATEAIEEVNKILEPEDSKSTMTKAKQISELKRINGNLYSEMDKIGEIYKNQAGNKNPAKRKNMLFSSRENKDPLEGSFERNLKKAVDCIINILLNIDFSSKENYNENKIATKIKNSKEVEDVASQLSLDDENLNAAVKDFVSKVESDNSFDKKIGSAIWDHVAQFFKSFFGTDRKSNLRKIVNSSIKEYALPSPKMKKKG